MSKFIIKEKQVEPTTQRSYQLISVSKFVMVIIALLIPVLTLGPDAGEPCDPTSTSCAFRSYCINKVCRPVCKEDKDCPEDIECVTSEKRHLFTRELIKVCRLPNELQRAIKRSFDEIEKELDDTVSMSRKKTDVSLWLISKLTHERSRISTKQFDQYWSELPQDERRQLSVEQLGQMIILRHTSTPP